MSPLVLAFVLLIITGVALALLPMEPSIKATAVKVIIIVTAVLVIVWLLSLFGLLPANVAAELN